MSSLPSVVPNNVISSSAWNAALAIINGLLPINSVSGQLTLGEGNLSASISVQSIPLPFAFSGKPLAGQMVHVALIDDVPITIPANLAGTMIYAATLPSGDATFTLSYVRSLTVTEIGTIVFTSTGAKTLTSTAYASQSGDVLRITAPVAQDSTLADVGLTIESARV